MKFEKSCGAIIFKKNQDIKYLLLHYAAGHWGFVKGNVDGPEKEQETALRELEEETGISEAVIIGNFREKVTYFYRRHQEMIHKEVIYFLMQVSNGSVHISHEHIGYDWLLYNKSLQTLTFNNARRILKKAKDYLKR